MEFFSSILWRCLALGIAISFGFPFFSFALRAGRIQYSLNDSHRFDNKLLGSKFFPYFWIIGIVLTVFAIKLTGIVGGLVPVIGGIIIAGVIAAYIATNGGRNKRRWE